MTAGFSIVVPTHGRPRAITECIETLAALDYPRDRLEVIVVEDGGPTDELAALRDREIDGLTVRWFGQPRSGPASARNHGASHARFEYVAFTDDDCRPCSDWIRQFALGFEDAPDCVLGGHTTNALVDNSYSGASQALVTHLTAWGQRSRAPFFASCNFALPRALFESTGGFDLRFARAGGEDRDLSDRLNAAGVELRHVPKARVDHFHHLSPRSFWRQHHRYGRAAYTYHQKRGTTAGGTPAPLAFYRDLLLSPFRKGADEQQRVRVFLLLLVSQVANAAGYFAARRGARAK